MKTAIYTLTLKVIICVALSASLCSCAAIGQFLNPFYEPPTAQALLGERNDKALNDTAKKEDSARKALEQMASYDRAHDPQPNKPVVIPAVIRLMWIPDHLNKSGDLVPSHYYYVKVLGDRWNASDAFELESQLGSKTAGAGNYPYIYGEQK